MQNTHKGSSKLQLIVFLASASLLTHAIGRIGQVAGANSQTGSNEPAPASSQPLWSYQVKPNGYSNAPAGHNAYLSAPHHSIFEALGGLSQRQGSLTASPFLSILPIILIAAGGMLLLLPFLTMMIASPFGGAGFGGGFNNGAFGYPQAAALGKRRSMDQLGQRGLMDIIEHVSSTIDELTKRQPAKRAKSSEKEAAGVQNDGQQSMANGAMHAQPDETLQSASSNPMAG